ncbi:MAG TPA: hypothetical protein PK733_07295 [Clostridiales bacterium]|nr:hypothetical protein [Clostridiales bacterium]
MSEKPLKENRLLQKENKIYATEGYALIEKRVRGKIPLPLFVISLLFLENSIILITEVLLEVLGLLADHHIPFNMCQTISSTIYLRINYHLQYMKNGCRVLRGHLCPYGSHCHGIVTLGSTS